MCLMHLLFLIAEGRTTFHPFHIPDPSGRMKWDDLACWGAGIQGPAYVIPFFMTQTSLGNFCISASVKSNKRGLHFQVPHWFLADLLMQIHLVIQSILCEFIYAKRHTHSSSFHTNEFERVETATQKRWKSEKLYKRKLSMRHSTLNKFTQNKHQLQVIAHILFLPKILKKID